jgi:putative oxidoreductase
MSRRSLVTITRVRSGYARISASLNGFGWLPNLGVRLSVGFMFFSGAVGKLADMGKFTAMFQSLGIPAAQLLAPAVAAVELAGGLALMLGLATRPVSLALAMDMVGALVTDIGPDLARKYSTAWSYLSNLFYSSEWLLIGLLGFLVCLGAGPASLDALIDRHWVAAERESGLDIA